MNLWGADPKSNLLVLSRRRLRNPGACRHFSAIKRKAELSRRFHQDCAPETISFARNLTDDDPTRKGLSSSRHASPQVTLASDRAGVECLARVSVKTFLRASALARYDLGKEGGGAMFHSLDRLRGLITRPAHTYRPTVETFPDIDTQRLSKEMQLAKRGETRGRDNQPPTDSISFDAVEAEILEHVAAAQKRSHEALENHLAGFRQRLIDLGCVDKRDSQIAA